jgi:hypothetical protein
MPKLPALVIAAALAVPAVAAADVHTYTRVNEATVQYYDDSIHLTVDGVGPDGARTFNYLIHNGQTQYGGHTMSLGEVCYRNAMLALSKPGRYTLKLTFDPFTNPAWGRVESCSLRRVEPEAGQ